jgi:hypothetical protein
MALTRLTIYLGDKNVHVLDFDSEDEAKAALTEVQNAMRSAEPQVPTQIAGRLLIRPLDVQSADVGHPPSFGVA